MTLPRKGTWVAPTVRLVGTIGFRQSLRWQAFIQRIEMMAGRTIGSAVISFPTIYSENATVTEGSQASIRIGNKTVFRGVVMGRPVNVNNQQDEVQVTLADDKHRMARFVVGQPTIGSQGGVLGFRQVGQDLIFNLNGYGNKQPGQLDFDLGSAATKWTLWEILQWLVANYTDADVSLTGTQVTGWDAQIDNVDLVGQDTPQALDTLCALVGHTWVVEYTSSSTHIRIIPTAGIGQTERVRCFEPGGNARIAQAGEWASDDYRVVTDVAQVRDVHYAVSGFHQVEATYTTTGDDPLLVYSAATATPKWAARFVVDVTKYASHGLGQNLSAGARPKPWLPTLCTHVSSGSAFTLTPTQSTAPAEPFVWVSQDGEASNRRLLTSGYEIDLENGILYIEPTVETYDGSSTASVDTSGWTWASVGIWLTIATRLETVIVATAGEDSPFLPDLRANRIEVSDLVPRLILAGRELPNLSNYLAVTQAEDAVYTENPTAVLQHIANAHLQAMRQKSCTIIARMPFFPVATPGAKLTLDRDLGQTGSEVITRVVYEMHDSWVTEVEASNLAANVDPEVFLRRVR